MPLFTCPIHEHGDPDRPGPYPHEGVDIASEGTEEDFRRIGLKLWGLYAKHLTVQAQGEITFTPTDAEDALEQMESDSAVAEDMKWVAEQAHTVLTAAELRALLQGSVTVAFRGPLSLAGPEETNVVFHGTSSQDAAKIRASGKLTPRGAAAGNWATGLFGGNPSNPGLVYTTTDESAARTYAKEISRRQKVIGKGEVLRLTPDWSRAVPDEDVVADFLFAHRP